MKPRIAVETSSLRLPLRPAIAAAAEMGADGLQLQVGREVTVSTMTESARRQVLRELAERGLRIAALDLPVDRGLAEFEGLDERLDRIKQGMQLAFQLKTPSAIFRIGRIPTETDSSEYETLVAVLNDLARTGNHVGAVPTLSLPAEVPEVVAELIARIVEGPVGIGLDPSLFTVAGTSPVDAYRALFATVTHLVVRDTVRDMDGIVLEVPVGRGEVPWDELLSLMAEAEFGGWFVAKRTQGDDRSADLARAMRFVRNVLLQS